MTEQKAKWTTAYINDLPDSAFLYIEPGHEKDDEGRTVPRSARHFPYKDASGKVDLPHLRNAIARIPQSNAPGLTAEKKRQLQEKARRILREASGGKAVALKALDDGSLVVGGYGIVWGGTDLVGDYFTPETDFWFDKITPNPPILYHHGRDVKIGRKVVGKTRLIDPDDVGLWVESQISLSDEYLSGVRGLIEEGRLGYSSGAVAHLVERVPTKKGAWLKSWPIAEFSLTPTPAEPRTLGVAEVRALEAAVPELKALIPEEPQESGSESAEQDEIKARAFVSEHTTEENTMTEIDFDALAAQVAAKVARLMEPQTKDVGVQEPQPDQEAEKSFAGFLRAVARRDERALKAYEAKAALSGASGTTGGYLIPEQFANELLTAAAEQAIVLPRARRFPVHGPFRHPVIDLSSGASGVPAWFGGMRMYWHEEGGAITESEPGYKQATLNDHGIGALSYVSNRLLSASSINVDAQLRQMMGQALAWFMDYYFLRGDGAGKPLGILNSPAIVTKTRNNATAFDAEDALEMLSHLFPSSIGNAVWLMNPTVLPELGTMTVGQSPVWQPNFREGTAGDLLGMPVVFTEKLPTLGTEGDVVLADFSYYAVLLPTDIEIAVSEHYKFANDQTTFRVNAWVDGQPLVQEAATLADGSTEVSPFVVLK